MELKELMALVDTVANIDEERLALDRKSKELKKLEDEHKARIMQEMAYLGLTQLNGFSGRIAQVRTSVEPVVTDWHETLQYIRDTGSTDLLQRRLTVSAVKLRWADGLQIPGVDQYEESKLLLA